MKNSTQTNIKSALLALGFSITSSMTIAQTKLHPIPNDATTYAPINLSIADSGIVGNGIIWDYSMTAFEPNTPTTFTFRLPTANESTEYPTATIVEESTDGEKRILEVSNDWMKLHQKTNDNGTILSYTIPDTLFMFPSVIGTTWTSSSEDNYTSGLQFTIQTSTVCSVTGIGTLITPIATYDDVLKYSYTKTRDYYVSDTLYLTILLTEIKWVSESENAVILTLQHNDLEDQTVAALLTSTGAAAISDVATTANNLESYPNPASDIVYFSENVDQFSLYDSQGRRVKQGSNHLQLDVSNLEAGIYHLFLEINGNFLTKKIQIE